MNRKRKNKKHSLIEAGVELNVMPFIDIFSLLCTFLLFSAVFVSVGIIEVQVPFLSYVPPSSHNKEKEKHKRSLSVSVSISKNEIELNSFWDKAPKEQKKENFSFNTEGLDQFQEKLTSLKDKDSDTDKVTVFIDDDVVYEKIVQVLDRVKTRKNFRTESEKNLYPKIVFASVTL